MFASKMPCANLCSETKKNFGVFRTKIDLVALHTDQKYPVKSKSMNLILWLVNDNDNESFMAFLLFSAN